MESLGIARVLHELAISLYLAVRVKRRLHAWASGSKLTSTPPGWICDERPQPRFHPPADWRFGHFFAVPRVRDARFRCSRKFAKTSNGSQGPVRASGPAHSRNSKLPGIRSGRARPRGFCRWLGRSRSGRGASFGARAVQAVGLEIPNLDSIGARVSARCRGFPRALPHRPRVSAKRGIRARYHYIAGNCMRAAASETPRKSPARRRSRCARAPSRVIPRLARGAAAPDSRTRVLALPAFAIHRRTKPLVAPAGAALPVQAAGSTGRSAPEHDGRGCQGSGWEASGPWACIALGPRLGAGLVADSRLPIALAPPGVSGW